MRRETEGGFSKLAKLVSYLCHPFAELRHKSSEACASLQNLYSRPGTIAGLANATAAARPPLNLCAANPNIPMYTNVATSE